MSGESAAPKDEEHWLVKLHRLDEGIVVATDPKDGVEATKRYLERYFPQALKQR